MMFLYANPTYFLILCSIILFTKRGVSFNIQSYPRRWISSLRTKEHLQPTHASIVQRIINHQHSTTTISPSSLNFSSKFHSNEQQKQKQQHHHHHHHHHQESNQNNNDIRIRLNKVFKATHSRREADKLISSGRVSVNGQRVISKGGYYVIPHVDIVALDGKVVKGWEDMNAVESMEQQQQQEQNTSFDDSLHTKQSASDQQSKTKQQQQQKHKMIKSHFEYIKFFKPVGVTCTTDKSVKGNIIDSIESHGYQSPHRIYPVGRLDKETSGLILLTSDGRLPNAVLRGMNKQPKVYKVEVDLDITDRDIQRLRDGIVITTVAQRDYKAKKLTQRTKPCLVDRVGDRTVQMTLMEGRNRQIRKMMGALGYTVIRLHRTRFMNISLSTGQVLRNRTSTKQSSQSPSSAPNNEEGKAMLLGLKRPGDWSFLDQNEMKLVENALQSATLNQNNM